MFYSKMRALVQLSHNSFRMDVALLGAGSHIPPKGFSRSHLCFSVRYPLEEQGLPQIRAWMWQSAESRGPYFGKALFKGVTRHKDQNPVIEIGSRELH